MKFTIFLLAVVFSAGTAALPNFNLQISREAVEKLKQDLTGFRLTGTTAIINEWADKLFTNLDDLIANSTMDPMAIDGFDQEFLGSGIKLTNGQLSGISTMERYKDVTVNYESNTRILTVTIPIQFKKIQFTYDYLVRILIISYGGGVIGTLNNFKMNYQFQLDYKTYHIDLKASNIMDSGYVDLTFTGNILDIVVNLISKFATLILHPFIVGVIQLVCNAVVNNVVDAINTIIDEFLHPTTVAKLFNEI